MNGREDISTLSGGGRKKKDKTRNIIFKVQ